MSYETLEFQLTYRVKCSKNIGGTIRMETLKVKPKMVFCVECPMCKHICKYNNDMVDKELECVICYKIFYLEDEDSDDDCGLGYDSCDLCGDLNCECNDLFDGGNDGY